METGRNTRVTYLQASWVCFRSTRPYRKSTSFLRYLEWISIHIRSPNINGWLGRNCILNILGHQPTCLNLQWQTMRSHWVFLTEKQEGTRVRQVRCQGELQGDTFKLRYQIPTDGSFIQFFLKFHGMYWSKRALAFMWAPTLSKLWMAITITLLLWKQIERTSWYII